MKGSVRLAVRRQGPFDTVVVKTAYRGIGGISRVVCSDARCKLRREYAFLQALARTNFLAPRPLAFEEGDIASLICTDVGGDSLANLPEDLRWPLFCRAAQAVVELHQLGIVHRDCKPSNFLVSERATTLIDFELAAFLDEQHPPSGGTPGYMADDARHEGVARDVFALGSCLLYAALGCDPAALAEDKRADLLRFHGLDRHADLLNACYTKPLTAKHFIERLINLPPGPRRRAPRAMRSGESLRLAVDAARASRKFRAREQPWANRHMLSDDCGECLNLGAAGSALALATICSAVAPRTERTLGIKRACHWLAARPPPPLSAGLFSGNAGVALALATLGQRYRQKKWLGAAKARLAAAVAGVRLGVDLYSGAAGVIWAACLMSEVLGGAAPSASVRPVVDFLCDTQIAEHALIYWAAPAGNDGAQRFILGAAHGVAGIAIALAAWGRLTANSAVYGLAVQAMQRLYSHGRAADGKSLRFCAEAPIAAHNAVWCHGAAGFLWCLLQEFSAEPCLTEAIDWAAQACFTTPLNAGALLCHGLAGRLELANMLQALPRHRPAAGKYAREAVAALRFHAQKKRTGCVWDSEERGVVTPALWIGFLGPAVALKLYATGTHEAVLSRGWLKTLGRSRAP